MQFKQRNIATMLVAKAVAATAGLENTNITAQKSSLATGEPVIMSTGGVIVDATGTLPKEFKVAVKLADGDIKLSDTIKASMVKKVTVQKYVAGANQVDYIGYNGTTGSIDVMDDNVYKVNITIVGTDAADFSRRTIKHGVYKSDSAATQSEIAAGLTNSLITNFSREGIKLRFGTDLIKFERINSGAKLADVGNIAATKGSKVIKSASDDTANIVAGSILRFGTTGAGVAPCYVVTSVDSGAGAARLYTLDIPYQGDTVAAKADVETVTEGNWGIKMTGAELPYEAFRFNYGRSTWIFGLDGFGSTIKTNTTAMSLGSGEGEAINELESWINLNRGNAYLNSVAVKYPTLYSETTSNYAVIHFQYTDDYVSELGHGVDAHKELYIACVAGDVGAYKDANTGIGTIIDAYATAYKWDIVYNGSTTTAGVLAVGA